MRRKEVWYNFYLQVISVSPGDASISDSDSDRHSELVKGWCKEASVQMLYGKDAGYWDGENLVAQSKDIAIRTSPEESPSSIQDDNCYSSSTIPEPQWGGKYKVYIYVTVVYWMSSSLFL